MSDLVTEVTVFGPFAVRRGDAILDVGGPRPRTLFAALLARPDAAVSRDELVRELWQERPPRTAIETLHSYVSRLRRALDAPGANGPRITTQGQGYSLQLGSTRLDAWTFAQDVEAGAALLRDGSPGDALRTLRGALGRWRGEPYAGLAQGPIIDAEAARLLELRASAIEDRIDASLATGAVAALIPELEGLVRTNPLRERLHAQRMLALYRAGRQGAALEAFREARALLVDELGVEPGPLLQRVQGMVLAQADELTDVTTADLEGTGPSLRLVARAARHNPSATADDATPPQPSSFDDRGVDVEGDPQVATLVELTTAHRLLTITAPSGAGKTHLIQRAVPALETVARPVVLVEVDDDPARSPLAALAAARRVTADLRTVAATFETGGILALDLGDGDVDAAASVVATLLARAPRLRIVVTARERLRLPEEHRWRLSLLAVPPQHADLATTRTAPAVRFFVDCVRRWHPYFSLEEHNYQQVRRITRALEGWPLGLSLAAEQLETMPLETLVESVERDPGALRTRMRAGAARHRSLADAITTLTDPLSVPQRQLLSQLHVFAGGFTPEAVAAVCGDAHNDCRSELAALLDGSSLTPLPSHTGTTRYRALPFVAQLSVRDEPSDAGASLMRRHTDHYVDLADEAAPHLTGAHQVHWLNRLHEEHDNLRAVLSRSLQSGDLIPAATVAGSMTWFWLHFGHADEGVGWIERIERVGQTKPEAMAGLDPVVRSRYRLGAARLFAGAGHRQRAQSLLRTAVDDLVADGPDDLLAVTLAALASATMRRGDGQDAEALLDRAERVAKDTPWAQASIADVRSAKVRMQGDVDNSRALLGRAERHYRDAGDEWSACLARLRAARLAALGGDTKGAVRLHRTNLARTIELTASTFDFVGLPRDLHGLAILARRGGFGEVAEQLQDVAADLPVRRRADDVAVGPAQPPNPRDRIANALEVSSVLASKR